MWGGLTGFIHLQGLSNQNKPEATLAGSTLGGTLRQILKVSAGSILGGTLREIL